MSKNENPSQGLQSDPIPYKIGPSFLRIFRLLEVLMLIQSCGQILERWFHVSDEVSVLKGGIRPASLQRDPCSFRDQIGLSSGFSYLFWSVMMFSRCEEDFEMVSDLRRGLRSQTWFQP